MAKTYIFNLNQKILTKMLHLYLEIWCSVTLNAKGNVDNTKNK